MEFITSNLSSIIVGAIIAACCVLVIVRMIKKKDSCSCGCAQCPGQDICHKKEK